MAQLAPLKLEVPGEREFVEANRAREFVALWTEQLTAHRQEVQAILSDDNNDASAEADLANVVLCDRIRLSDKSFSDEAAEIIAAFLKEPFMGGRSIASGILYAELDDIIAGRMTEMGLHVLQTICDAFVDAKLVDVNLSDNAIGQQGIGACQTVLSMPSLERLALCNNGLSEATMAEVADILTKDESGTGCIAANLTKIHFYNNMSGEGGCKQFARILEKSSKFTDIRFSSTRAGKTGSDIVASALDAALEEGRNANLEKLDLCDNNFGNKASQDALFRALGCTTCLKYLDLRDCDLEDDGVKKVCHALFESDSALEHLDLSGNNVGRRGAKQIADYIRDSGGKLKVLCLDDNDLTSRGVVHIASAFHGSEDGHAIERLQLNCTMCGAIGARALIDAFGPDGKDLPHLKKICLDGNSFKEEIVGELEVAFDNRLVEMEENDSDGEADDDLSDEDSDEEDDDEEEQNGEVDALTDAMNKSLVV
jgi:Ran GTPase-activating protein 1